MVLLLFELREAQNQLYSIQNEYLEATLKLIENKINLKFIKQVMKNLYIPFLSYL